ncbi:hypothetical protein HKCCE2091_08940 [Rhodobacterales bacterium HKCCE2091]|nr:hypothetical protein [Rhodobacterales bacterium HKCCE2091]
MDMIQSGQHAHTARAIARLPITLLSGFYRILEALADSGRRADEVARLNSLTDEELAARGTTRVAEVQRIFGVYPD